MRLDDFDFDLPEDNIALRPAEPRDAARLLAVNPDGSLQDRVMTDLPGYLRAGDAVVFNDTRVIPARLSGRRLRGELSVAVEATLHRRLSPNRWSAFMRPGKRLAPGDRIVFGQTEDRACAAASLDATLESKGEGGEVELAFDLSGPDLDTAIATHGVMPLPPYIASKRAEDERDLTDYQTIYARLDGSVAAPTAGLHFTPALMEAMQSAGVSVHYVTLHVGAGTFLPVKTEDIEPAPHACRIRRGQRRNGSRRLNACRGRRAGASSRSAPPRCGCSRAPPARTARSIPSPARPLSSSRPATAFAPPTCC